MALGETDLKPDEPTGGFEEALRNAQPYEALREAVRAIVARTSRGLAQAALETLRQRLRAEGRDTDEDVVLDVLDDLTGWTSPSRKLCRRRS